MTKGDLTNPKVEAMNPTAYRDHAAGGGRSSRELALTCRWSQTPKRLRALLDQVSQENLDHPVDDGMQEGFDRYGHPADGQWGCEKHVPEARKLQNKTQTCEITQMLPEF